MIIPLKEEAELAVDSVKELTKAAASTSKESKQKKEAVLQLKLDKKSVDKTEEKESTETTKNQGAENNLQSAEQSKAKIAAEAKVAAQKEANAEEEEAAAKEQAVQIKNE